MGMMMGGGPMMGMHPMMMGGPPMMMGMGGDFGGGGYAGVQDHGGDGDGGDAAEDGQQQQQFHQKKQQHQSNNSKPPQTPINPAQNNAISKLYELSKRHKEPEPAFETVAENVLDSRRTQQVRMDSVHRFFGMFVSFNSSIPKSNISPAPFPNRTDRLRNE